MGELLLLILVAGSVVLAVAWPLLGADTSKAEAEPDPEREAAVVRHRLALEALRDIEADRRAGSLDEASYHAQREEAEAHAARTLRALEAVAPTEGAEAGDGKEAAPARGRPWRLPALVGGILGLLLLAAFAAPPPLGIAERDARIERIRQLTATVSANHRDVDALGELADLYLAGGTPDDVSRALVSLVLMRDAAPQSRDANQRLVTLLVRTGLWDDADAATDRYAGVVGEDDPDIPFFRGLVARGSGDEPEAVRQFDRFLEIAPNDPRAEMIRGLRDDLADGAGG
jgi:tetratricopeptide (TPR) repeat protein